MGYHPSGPLPEMQSHVWAQMDVAIVKPRCKLHTLVVPNDQMEIAVCGEYWAGTFRLRRIAEMNRLRKLNHAVAGIVSKNVFAQFLMLRPNVTEVSSAMNQDYAVSGKHRKGCGLRYAQVAHPHDAAVRPLSAQVILLA